jgi:hypothetical protein
MNRGTIRRLYREALVNVFGAGCPEIDDYLLESVKSDIHLGGQDPGGWSSKGAALSIYCESGIPNATDIIDPSWFGVEGKVTYNSDKWSTVDETVNLMLDVTHPGNRIYHEPVNSAVVNVYFV